MLPPIIYAETQLIRVVDKFEIRCRVVLPRGRNIIHIHRRKSLRVRSRSFPRIYDALYRVSRQERPN